MGTERLVTTRTTLLTKLVRFKWLDISLVLFLLFYTEAGLFNLRVAIADSREVELIRLTVEGLGTRLLAVLVRVDPPTCKALKKKIKFCG